MKNSKYIFGLTLIFAVFILSSAIYTLFFYKTDYLKIFVVYYKPAPLIKSEIFEPIQGGRAIAHTPSRNGTFTQDEINWLNNNMIGDNTGDNISELNRYFAENSALYWIWKNTNTPYVGMFQYRRLLSINSNHNYPILEFPSMRFIHLGINHLYGFSKEFLRALELEKKFILPWFATHDILISEPIKLNAYKQYQKEHDIKDLHKALNILKQKYPHMYDFAIENLNSEEGIYPSNLIITRREIFNNYAEWLFSIMLPLYEEMKEELQYRNTEQKLAFAYLSERLFTIYFRYHQKHNGLRIKEFPHALASNFFTPPQGNPYIKIKTDNWEDIFLSFDNQRLCGFNNPDYHCGKYEIIPPEKIKVIWDSGKKSTLQLLTPNTFKFEN
ncbi:MAG: DUF4422 domain-containing protein [Alphaproteobacteria bacterium]|nr:DUF4422 domain-containing protein [Alphaproteobacteria bacterium]